MLAVLERHRVDYLVVGGVSALAYGARRPTLDFDCLAERSSENLTRLAAAMRELGARLRVAGLSDAEAQRLPSMLDAEALQNMELSTWRTDAGDFDVLADISNETGQHLRYEDLASRAVTVQLAGSTVRAAAVDDVIASKEWAGRPKDHEALPELHAIRARRLAQLRHGDDPE